MIITRTPVALKKQTHKRSGGIRTIKKRSIAFIVIAFCLAALTACGGGGGGAAPTTTTAPGEPTKATIKLATAGSLGAGVQIGAIDVTVVLLTGVTVKASPDNVNPSVLLTDTGVVTASGVAGTGTIVGPAVYTAATGTMPGTVQIAFINVPGFSIGEFCTVTTDIAAGLAVTASNVIGLEALTVWDESGQVITGLSPAFTAVLR